MSNVTHSFFPKASRYQAGFLTLISTGFLFVIYHYTRNDSVQSLLWQGLLIAIAGLCFVDLYRKTVAIDSFFLMLEGTGGWHQHQKKFKIQRIWVVSEYVCLFQIKIKHQSKSSSQLFFIWPDMLNNVSYRALCRCLNKIRLNR